MSKSIKNKIILQSQIPQLPNQERLSKNRMSGHFVDLRLKNEYERETKGLESIWDDLSINTQNNIKDETIIEGIRLTVPEDRLIHSLLNLFYTKGTENQLGNLRSTEMMIGNQNLPVPRLRITPNELYAEVTGKKRYSGKEIEVIKSTLNKLNENKFLIIYKRHRKQGKETVIDRIEEYQSILSYSSIFEGISEKEDKQLDQGSTEVRSKKELYKISLNPIFIDQIDTKFVEYPQDINKLTDEAAGGSRKVTQAMITLRNYVLRIISSNKKSDKKTTYFNINKERLIYVLGLENYLKSGRKKRLEEHINNSIELCKKMNLISGVKITKNVNDEYMYVFEINLVF